MTEPTSILIVDDDVNFASSLSKVLSKKGYVTTTMDGPVQALALIKDKPFDVILMDIKMPVMNGLEVYKNIKTIRPGAVVILITAFSIDDLVRDVVKQGAYAVIAKPFDIDTIVNMIEKSKNGAFLAVVDDDRNICKTMQNSLEKKGFSVATCLTGEEAIFLSKEKKIDVVFIDLKLPVLNGLETYLEIKKINSATAAVMMTAYRQEVSEMSLQALEKGAYTCLYKPFDMDVVIMLIEEIINKRKETKNG